MIRSRFLASVFAFVVLCPTSFAGITFGPLRGKPGESVRLVTISDTKGGTIQREVSGKSLSGTILLTRVRDIVWTFRDPAADGTRRGMVKVAKLASSSRSVINGKPEESDDVSPLTGKMFSMSKPPEGDWTFDLDGSIPSNRVTREIDELKVYLKRDWFPTREVNTGDSWEFDPTWIKMLIERDFPAAKTIGTMRLSQIRTGMSHKTAVIAVSIRSSGADFKSNGSSSDGTVELNGQLVVNLDTMLDERLELKGTVTTNTDRAGETSKLTLPVNLLVTKSFVREP